MRAKEKDEVIALIDNRINELSRLFNEGESLPYPITETQTGDQKGALPIAKVNKFLKNRNEVIEN